MESGFHYLVATPSEVDQYRARQAGRQLAEILLCYSIISMALLLRIIMPCNPQAALKCMPFIYAVGSH